MMAQNKAFCAECRNDVEFAVTTKQLEGTLKGETYIYVGKAAHCLKCGAELYVEEVNDFNLKALYDTYREQKGIVSWGKIAELPAKYAIGKRPMSLLLGWGEQTFSRYCEGDVPTKQYSEVLQRLYDEPQYYQQILEENKANLKSEVTYKKSKKAVERLLRADAYEQSKIALVIEYLLAQCEDITPLALQKALYYIQGFYYAFYKSFLFSEECQAWVHGPVYRDIYCRYKDYKFDPIKGSKTVDETIFSAPEKAILDSVVKNICCYSGKVLEKFTHAETPWLSARGSLPESEPSDCVIAKADIGKYFESVKKKYNMLNPNDIKAYAQTMFQQI